MKKITNFFSIESFSDMLKMDNKSVIDNSFKNSEKKQEGYNDKATIVGSMKTNRVILNIVLKRFKELCSGKSGNTPRKYIEDIESTSGNYAKRDTKVRVSVRTMYELVTSSSAKSDKAKLGKVDNGVLKLYVKLYDMVVSNSKWSTAFQTAYKFHKTGNDSSTIIFMNYVFMVYTLEYLTLILRVYADDISQYKFEYVNERISNGFPSFVKAAADNVIPILINCENTKNPKGYVDNAIKIEKNKKSTESDSGAGYKVDCSDKSLEDLNNLYSQEDALIAAILFGAVSILSVITIIHTIRYIIYSMSCLVVDITKSLQDQSYTLLVSIESLERKLSTLKPDSKEYKDLVKVIESQKYYTKLLIDATNKLSDSEMENIDDIRKKEYDDDETINDDSGGSEDGDGGLDI